MPKTHPMPTHCPVTGEPLVVTRLEGPTSGVALEGHFTTHEFTRLNAESLETVRLFLKTRGNLKEMERLLGVSYPTVRNRFDRLLQDLGYELQDQPAETAHPNGASTILDALEAGEITAEEAATELEKQR